jgi:ribosomal protein S18 acetylase RimI-like enzyme
LKERTLKVTSIQEGLEQAFWEHVNRDPLNYYFFILDWRLRRDQTKILMALDKDKIEGLMVIYDNRVAQLRGSREAVGLLLGHLDLEKVELQVPLDCEDLALAKYTAQFKTRMMLMRLERGEENLQVTTMPVRLGSDDAEGIAELMRVADPVRWGEMAVERIRTGMDSAFWLGIKRDQRLVSVGNTRLMNFASNIGAVATQERYRNRGYATSIVSTLVKEILEISPMALIHVLPDNEPAVRVYSKVGFKPYKTFFSMKDGQPKNLAR